METSILNMYDMDIISQFPDDLLVKILSFLPTKTAVSTTILSKRWKFLWMFLSKLEYSCYRSKPEFERLRCFLDRNRNAVSCNLRELEISIVDVSNEQNIIPMSLYSCKLLVTLKLSGNILVDVPPMVSLSSLKTLRLQEVAYFNEDSFQRLVSVCPVLEDLLVKGSDDDNMVKCIVIAPLLQSLALYMLGNIDEFVIDTPSLKYLKLEYCNGTDHYCLIENMPKLKEAYVGAYFNYTERLFRSITSIKSLKLCMGVYPDGFVFNQLEHLQLCTCPENTMNVLVRLLKDSPNLRVLELFHMEAHNDPDDTYLWNEPSSVPECMLSSLQTFKWSGYLGHPEERDLAIYILKNCHRLKTATILSDPDLVTFGMVKELAFSSRASTTCQLYFD